jgi:lycopene elongase/hydratase (dihydrobisanhydrobacterioruberin-forming)
MTLVEHRPIATIRSWAVDLVLVARPQFWLLSAVALQLGFVLATHRIVPRGSEIVVMGNAALVVGPLLWFAVFCINDAYDVASDRFNARKAGAPVVRGRLTPRLAVRLAAGAGGLAVLAAVPLGGLFTLGTGLVALLGWAYSAPPLRLKARPGADVTVNATVVGVLGPLGGWVAMTGTVDGFPWPIALIGFLALAGLYLPTTVVDREADERAGVRTTAVVLGVRGTFELGFALWAASAVLAFWLAATGVVLDRSLLPLHLAIAPVLLWLYRSLLRGRPPFRSVLVVAGTYIVPCAAFALTYAEPF